jgi:hypothetical protein
MVGEQLVADIVEVADDRHLNAHPEEPLLDVRHRRRRLVAVDGDAHELGAGASERRHLLRSSLDVGGVGIGHRLDDHRRAAADDDAADIDRNGPAAFLRCGRCGHRALPCHSGARRGLARQRRRIPVHRRCSGEKPPPLSAGSRAKFTGDLCMVYT